MAACVFGVLATLLQNTVNSRKRLVAGTQSGTVADYNYPAFDADAFKQGLRFRGGPAPGEHAPRFLLDDPYGRSHRLAGARDRPSLVEFVSITCPMVLGGRAAMKHLHASFCERVDFVSIYVREAHPGEIYPQPSTLEEKARHARDWISTDKISWTVVVDAPDGAVHVTYGRVPNAVYLLTCTGTVAFRSLWSGERHTLEHRRCELLSREAAGDSRTTLGQRTNWIVPLLAGLGSVYPAVARGGQKALRDFRAAMGSAIFGIAVLASGLRRTLSRSCDPKSTNTQPLEYT